MSLTPLSLSLSLSMPIVIKPLPSSKHVIDPKLLVRSTKGREIKIGGFTLAGCGNYDYVCTSSRYQELIALTC